MTTETPIYNSIIDFINSLCANNNIIENREVKLILPISIYQQLLREIYYIKNQNVISGVITLFYGSYTIKVNCKEIYNDNLRDKFNQIFKSILE